MSGSIIKFNEADLFGMGFSRVHVEAFRHLLRQIGAVANQQTLPETVSELQTVTNDGVINDLFTESDAQDSVFISAFNDNDRINATSNAAEISELKKAVMDLSIQLDSMAANYGELLKTIDSLKTELSATKGIY